MNQSDNTGVSPCARRFLRFRSTAALPARAIAFAAAIMFSFGASYVHAQELLTLTAPRFQIDSTFSVDVTPGGETAELLRDHPTTPLLTSTFSLAGADLTIEAVAVDNANAAAVRDGIDIRFPQAAYDSVAGGSGGVTTADGLRLEVADLSSIPARLSLMDIRDAFFGDTRYSSAPDIGTGSFIPWGAVHIVGLGATVGLFERAVALQNFIYLIQAHEIVIAPDYSGGAFILRLTLRESGTGSIRIGARDTFRTEARVEPRPSRCPPS